MKDREILEKIVSILDSVIANFDQHLREDHKQENHGYIEKGKDATLRFYLENCHQQLSELKKVMEN